MKKFVFLSILIIFALLTINVNCWSQNDKNRSQNQQQAKQNQNTKKTQRPQSRQQQQKAQDPTDQSANKIKNDPKIKKIQEDLNKAADPKAEEQKRDEEIKKIEQEPINEEDEAVKQQKQQEREQRIKDIQANTEKIKEQRLKLEKEKKEREEQIRKSEQDRISKLKEEQERKKQEKQEQEQEAQQNLSAEDIEKNLEGGFSSDHIRDEDMTQWLSDWEKHMQDFKADEMLSFEVASRGFEVFFEDITQECTLRGAYFINFDAKDGLDLKILDPKNKEVYKNIGKRQGIFNFNATEVGTYSFYFQNRRSSEKKTVSFVVDVSDNDTHLQSKDLDDITQLAKDIKTDLRTQLSEFKILRRKDKTAERKRKSNSSKILVASIIETVVIIGCTVFQVMYIKKILDNRSFV